MTNSKEKLLAQLRTDAGSYAMLAIDQRESLRAMLPLMEDGSYAVDQKLIDFKASALRSLSAGASGILIDRPLGLTKGRPTDLDPGCGLIVAADILHQQPGELLTHSTVDPEITPEFLSSVGAVAVKFLVLWKADESAADRRDVLAPFVELARDNGVLSLIEGVVRPAEGRDWVGWSQRHDAILAAAEEFAGYDPDIYKAEVPGYIPGDVSLVRDQSLELSRIVPGPWVVLSNGVEPAMFPAALAEAMRGGASGFLAGRAVWQDVTRSRDLDSDLAATSTHNLARLRDIADAALSVRSSA